MAEMNREERIIKNAWRKTGYEWFPKEVDKITSAVMKEGGEIAIAAAAAVTMTEEDEAILGVLNEFLEEELPH
jgi:hypothetical protein